MIKMNFSLSLCFRFHFPSFFHSFVLCWRQHWPCDANTNFFFFGFIIAEFSYSSVYTCFSLFVHFHMCFLLSIHYDWARTCAHIKNAMQKRLKRVQVQCPIGDIVFQPYVIQNGNDEDIRWSINRSRMKTKTVQQCIARCTVNYAP